MPEIGQREEGPGMRFDYILYRLGVFKSVKMMDAYVTNHQALDHIPVFAHFRYYCARETTKEDLMILRMCCLRLEGR